MTGDQIEVALEQVLARHANELRDGPAFGTDDVIAAARTTLVRRRRAVLSGIAAGVVMLLAAGALAARGPGNALPPIAPDTTDRTTTAPTVGPTVTATPPTGAVSAASVGLGLIYADAIVSADGSTIPLALPVGAGADSAIRVPDGWVLGVTDNGGASAWFRSDTGALSRIGNALGGYDVSPDGHTVVVSGVDGYASVVAFRLPGLQRVASTTFDRGMGPVVLGASGDFVVIQEASGDGTPTVAASWNTLTGELRPTDRALNIWGVARDGQVLRHVPMGGGNGPPSKACVDLVAITAMSTVRETGFCAASMAAGGTRGLLSPDGVWALIGSSSAGSWQLERTDDLHAGLWRPQATGIPAGAFATGWDTDSTFIVRTQAGEVYRCGVTRPCQPLAVTPGFGGPYVIPTRGA